MRGTSSIMASPWGQDMLDWGGLQCKSTFSYNVLTSRFWSYTLIPKIIHQTCPSIENLSDEIKLNIEFMRENNPGWLYKIYNDADLRYYIASNLDRKSQTIIKKLDKRYSIVLADLFR